jgi:hypothetical protein
LAGGFGWCLGFAHALGAQNTKQPNASIEMDKTHL